VNTTIVDKPLSADLSLWLARRVGRRQMDRRGRRSLQARPTRDSTLAIERDPGIRQRNSNRHASNTPENT